MTAKIGIKRILSRLMSFSGILSLVERLCLFNKAFVLMYHRILDSAYENPYPLQRGMFVSKESFEMQLVFLRDRFDLVFLEDLVEKILSGKSFRRCCAITFDDGWVDNYTVAFPILKKYHIPATIFLATGFVGTGRIFWPEEIAHYLGRHFLNQSKFEVSSPRIKRFAEEILKYYRLGKEDLLDQAIELLKSYSSIDREEILEYLRSQAGDYTISTEILSWDEVRKMHASGLVRFGAHTVTHDILDQVSLEKVREEVSKSRDYIEHYLGCKVDIFAYPNGNFNSDVQQVLKENGFLCAVTTQKGFLSQATPLMEIPRIGIHEDICNTVPMFRSRILFNSF